MSKSSPDLMQETDQESTKHMCQLSNKSFPCCRYQAIDSTNHHHQGKSSSFNNNGGRSMNVSSNSNDSCYGSRKGPIKKVKVKVKDSSEVSRSVALDKICKKCGKGFQSWKALFGHMKCHSDKVQKRDLNQDFWISRPESDNENSGEKNSRKKRSRSRKKRIKRCIVTSTTTTTTALSSISMNANMNQISNNTDQEQETEIAMCLMMLSRDVGQWGSELDSSALLKLTKVEGKQVIRNGSKMKKLAETQMGIDCFGRSELGSKGFQKILIKSDEFDDQRVGEFKDVSSRKFECSTCNRGFCSYQALGGHKANHKKFKGHFDSKIQGENKILNKPMLDQEHTSNGYGAKTLHNHQKTSSFNLEVGSLKRTVVLGEHECPICSRIFSSGQALGGHKRSHLIAEAKLNQQNNMSVVEKTKDPVGEIRGFLDLNMPPDPIEEEETMSW